MARNRILTEEMVFQRTKCNRMDLIRNLNLWGNDLSQIAALRHMPNLEVLSLSVNHIESLSDLRFCPKLTELYLRKNNISDLTEVAHLRTLRHLKVLWLSDNPCATLPQYRLYVLNQLPALVKLDSLDVTEEERRQAARADVGNLQTCVEPDFEPVLRADSRGDVAGHDDARRRYHHSLTAPAEFQEEMPIDRRSGGGRTPHGGFYEDQHSGQADFHVPPGQHYGGPPDMYDDHSPDTTPRNGGHQGSPGQIRGAYAEGYRSIDYSAAQAGPPRSAWDSPDTRGRRSSNGESSLGDSGQRRFSGNGDGDAHRGDPYMHGAEQVGVVDTSVPGPSAARADNILCAVLALIKELDQQGLELVRRAIEQRQGEA
jgi:hypothetical protein